MAYADFDVFRVEQQFGVRFRPTAVFPPLVPAAPPGWLVEMLARGSRMRVASEKARNELLVAPILLAACELSGDRLALYSGERFDIDPAAGLAGECDFLLALADPTPVIRAPVVLVVEAKKQDIEGGVGQCAAQMLAARRFGGPAGPLPAVVYGCVTTGEVWQFLRLEQDGGVIAYDTGRVLVSDLGRLLAAFLHAAADNAAVAAA